jgi:hypothetical protein
MIADRLIDRILELSVPRKSVIRGPCFARIAAMIARNWAKGRRRLTLFLDRALGLFFSLDVGDLQEPLSRRIDLPRQAELLKDDTGSRRSSIRHQTS